MSAQKTSPEAEKLKGSVKEAIGKLIGDGKVEAEGKSEQESPQESPKSDVKPKSARTS